MTLMYDGWCRRIDLIFRSRYPYLSTKIFKLSDYEYQIYITEEIDDFARVTEVFNLEIKYMTAPVSIVDKMPAFYQQEIECIGDHEIPSKFEGFPLTRYQIHNHISSTHQNIRISSISEDHENKTITIEVVGGSSKLELEKLQETVDYLKNPYVFVIKKEGAKGVFLSPQNEVFSIVSSQSLQALRCDFLERDEKLWYENIEDIYSGSFSKKDLYFFESKKTSCLVNFSKFQNANLRNHLLLYDVVFCVLPLVHDMSSFLKDQKVTKDEILQLVDRGRLKILNMQPESRLDHGFINEAFQTNRSSIVSRRALSALCAIDLVEMNNSYIFSDPEINKLIFPLIKELAVITKKDIHSIGKLLLWPKQALRSSLDTLNESGPMGISRYGVNNPIIENIPSAEKEKMEFEFVVNSDQIHLSHALDATYFPFFINGEKYSDHPYALMMGGMLNFFKSANFDNLSQIADIETLHIQKNPSIDLISLFDVNDYIPVLEFEEEISSSVIRKGANSLFSELSLLNNDQRNERISIYNSEVAQVLSKKNITKNALDLGEDALGLVLPFMATGKKLIQAGVKKAMNKFPAIKETSEYIEEKTSSSCQNTKNITILSQINRVARLKREYE